MHLVAAVLLIQRRHLRGNWVLSSLCFNSHFYPSLFYQPCLKLQPPHETTNGLAVKLTLNPRPRNAGLPFSQQWHPSEQTPLLPSTAPFQEFTSHQLDLSRPTVHANIALKSERSERVTPGHLSSGAHYLESSKPTHLLHFQPLLFSCCDPYGVAACASDSGDPFAARQRA